jgi:hypothetical protein
VSVVCCQVEVSATGWSLVKRSPTDCDVSECDREASIMRRPRPPRGCRVIGKRNSGLCNRATHKPYKEFTRVTFIVITSKFFEISTPVTKQHHYRGNKEPVLLSNNIVCAIATTFPFDSLWTAGPELARRFYRPACPCPILCYAWRNHHATWPPFQISSRKLIWNVGIKVVQTPYSILPHTQAKQHGGRATFVSTLQYLVRN